MAKRPAPTTTRTAAAAHAALAALADDAAPLPAPEVLTVRPNDPRLKFRPLDDLVLSPENERTVFDDASINVLMEQICEAGTLYKNLVGYPNDQGQTAVWDGGRRWRALHRAREQGRLPAVLATVGIPVLELESRRACLIATVAANQSEQTHFLDRGAALARIRDETGWSASRIARETGAGKDRLVQQLLQIHDRLPQYARERAYLPKDDPNHLKFSDCRDLVEQAKLPAPAADDDETGQESGRDVPLPLAMPQPRFTREEVAAAVATIQAEPRAGGEPVSVRLRRTLAALVPGADRFGPGDRVCEALGGIPDGFDDALRQEFGIDPTSLDITVSTTLGGLARWIIGQLAATNAGNTAPVAAPAAPTKPAQESKPQAVLGELPFPKDRLAYTGLLSSQLGIEKIWLEERDTGRRFVAVPEQRDIEDTAPGAGMAAP